MAANSIELPPVVATTRRVDTFDSQVYVDAPESPVTQSQQQRQQPQQQAHLGPDSRQMLDRAPPSEISVVSVPPQGSVLTGKQEHYLKRELLSAQTKWEVNELSHPTALQRFGAPFRSEAGEVAPEDSELPLLRYIFVHFVRNFPFLDQAQEKEFWQDKLQVFLESFANKHISSSDDRLEETKRAKLASKATKLVELMMVSGIPTASGYEERIRFSEMEVVDRDANEQGLMVNVPQGQAINGWDINVAGVRIINIKHHVRYHAHAVFLLRVKKIGEPEVYVARRFGDFARMHKKLRLELPGKVLPPLPRKNRSHSIYNGKDAEDDTASMSSLSTQDTGLSSGEQVIPESGSLSGFRSYLASWTGSTAPARRRSRSRATSRSSLGTDKRSSPRESIESGSIKAPSQAPLIDESRSSLQVPGQEPQILVREEQRVSLRAFLRNFLNNPAIANSQAMTDFLLGNPTELTREDRADMERRQVMDEKRIEEQRQFFEVARARARELDVHMEKFRRSVIERNGLRNLFAEIKRKDKIADLDPEFKKFAEWARIEVAATLYHLFLAEDNSPELFAQAKRIHGLVPYTALKQVVRFTNPAAVMVSILDIFMAQPLGAKSLLQRIFGLALGDGIRSIQKSLENLSLKINEPDLSEKIQNYTIADETIKQAIRTAAREDGSDVLIKILQSEDIYPPLTPAQTEQTFNAYVAWNNAVENVDDSMRQGAELYARLKILLKLSTRQRDKRMMLEMVEEPTTLRLFRDLFTIFYEPLIRVYKSANVYNSVTDFARFADDAIQTIERAQRQDVSADPNQTVQSFIDVCERHEDDLYKFIHEVHKHDNGLFDKLMDWIENILDFLRNGPKGGKLDMNALFQGAVEMRLIDRDLAMREINSLVKWQTARKRWHQDKTRLKMASGGDGPRGRTTYPSSHSTTPGASLSALGTTFQPTDFGLHPMDLQDLDLADGGGGDDDLDIDNDEDPDSDAAEDEEIIAAAAAAAADSDFTAQADPFAAERRRRLRRRDLLKRSAGEPVKPAITECHKLGPQFVAMLRNVLAE